MKLLIFILYLFFVCTYCISQNTKLILDEIGNDTLLSNEDHLSLYFVNDYNMKDEFKNIEILVNEKGEYINKNSMTPISCMMKITLHDNKQSDLGPDITGFLKGKIINGKKEGLWIKAIYNNGESKVIKNMNYRNGLLNGKYCVFNIKGDTLSFSYNVKTEKSVPVRDSDGNIVFLKGPVIFNNGNGEYSDYYYDTGIKKIEGRLFNGKKEGVWCYYGNNGSLIMIERYKNGYLISE